MTMEYILPENRPATKYEFLEFWSALYPALQKSNIEQKYKDNIGKPLTPDSTNELFFWKMGRKLGGPSLKSVSTHFIPGDRDKPHPGSRSDVLEFINRPGGPIFRIFWLHCLDDNGFPIYDQHVHRAMTAIMDSDISEISKNPSQIGVEYFDLYIPFFRVFGHHIDRKVDKALWTYGKAIGQPIASYILRR